MFTSLSLNYTLFIKFKEQDMVLIKASETIGMSPIKPKVDCQASSLGSKLSVMVVSYNICREELNPTNVNRP